MPIEPTVSHDAEFTQFWLDCLNALCASCDSRMIASPNDARTIRIAGERAIALLWTHAAPDPAWAADKQAAFATWLRKRAQASAQVKAGAWPDA